MAIKGELFLFERLEALFRSNILGDNILLGMNNLVELHSIIPNDQPDDIE